MEAGQGKVEKWETGKESSEAARRAPNRFLSALLKTEILRYAQDDMKTADCPRMSF